MTNMKEALREAKKQEELEKQRIADEVEKALKVRMIEVEREERANLQTRIKHERDRLQKEAEDKRRQAEIDAKVKKEKD